MNLRVHHVEDIGNNRYLISIEDNKNDYSGQFIVGSLFYDKVQKYIYLTDFLFTTKMESVPPNQ